jgi:transposase-like protein
MKGYQKRGKEVKWGAPAVKNTTNVESSKTINVVDSGRLMEIAEESLEALFFNVGMEAVAQLFEQDVVEIVGPKGKHNKNRIAYRHGSEQTEIALGDKKVKINKPRVRSGVQEIPLPSLSFFQNEDQLNRTILSRIVCGISTRKYGRTVDAGDGDVGCVSKSEVSRRFNTELKRLMNAFFNRRLTDAYPTIMIDGIERGGMVIIAALGITNDGRKEVLGLVEGGTENNIAVKSLFEDMIGRGLQADVPRLFVIDGSKALMKAVKDTFGGMALVQRCQVHKKRNVQSHLPLSEQANVGLAISRAYMEFDYSKALRQLNAIADSLETRYPSAAASMREGLEDTLTVHRLGMPGLLRKTLSNTNALESANSVAASVVRRISKWRDGEMVLRHMAAGFLEAERGFRRVQGYKELPQLVAALYNATGCTVEQINVEEAV